MTLRQADPIRPDLDHTGFRTNVDPNPCRSRVAPSATRAGTAGRIRSVASTRVILKSFSGSTRSDLTGILNRAE